MSRSIVITLGTIVALLITAVPAPAEDKDRDKDRAQAYVVEGGVIAVAQDGGQPAKGKAPTNKSDAKCESELYTKNDFEFAVHATVGETPEQVKETFSKIKVGYRVTGTLAAYDRDLASVVPAIPGEEYGNPLPTKREYSPTGRWDIVTCKKPDGTGFLEILPIGGESTTVGALIQRAVGELRPTAPTPVLNPPKKQIVQVPTVLHVGEAYWNTERVNTQTAGRVTVTVRLQPEKTVYLPGDGSKKVTCKGRGSVWNEKMEEEDVLKKLKCRHTYRNIGPYTLTTSVIFAVEGSTNAPENIGSLPPLSSSGEIEVETKEYQVVVN